MNKINKFYSIYIKTLPLSLKVILSFSFSIVIAQEFILFKMTPLFKNSYDLGVIFQKILLSLVSSILVYFFTTHYPKTKKKESLNTMFHNTFFRILNLSQSIFYSVYKQANVLYPKDLSTITRKDLLTIINRTQMRKKIKFTFDYLDYPDSMHLLSAIEQYFEKQINLILPFLEYLDKFNLEVLSYLMNKIFIHTDASQKLRERTIVSPEIFADFIIDFHQNAKKIKIESK